MIKSCPLLWTSVAPVYLRRRVANTNSEHDVSGSIPGLVNFFPRIVDSHCDRINSFFIANFMYCFDKRSEDKHPVAWKEYGAKYS